MSNTKTSSSLKTLCRTAIFLALLIAVQFVTRSMGQYVTGSLVNLILIASGLMCGLWGGLAVAVLSPICAFFIGIGPAFPQVVPAVALGNAVLVLLWVLIAGAKNAPIARQAIALVVAAVAKFLTLYLVIVKWLVPMVLTLNEKQMAVLSASFSFPQLITAVIGGVLAMLRARNDLFVLIDHADRYIGTTEINAYTIFHSYRPPLWGSAHSIAHFVGKWK